MTTKPKIGTKARRTYTFSDGSTISYEGVINDFDEFGHGWSKSDVLLFDPSAPEETEILEMPFPTARVVWFHEAYDGGDKVTDVYALKIRDGVYVTEGEHRVWKTADRVVSYEVIVD